MAEDYQMRDLSSQVSSLSDSIKNLSTTTIRAASRPITAAASAIKDQVGFSGTQAAGITVATAINPFVGQLAKSIIEKNKGTLSSAVRGMYQGTKDLAGAVKNKLNREKSQKNMIDGGPKEKLSVISKGHMSNQTRDDKGRFVDKTEKSKTRSKKRIHNTSYSRMYGSSDEIEAIDRLRISNAQWLIAVNTLTKGELKKKNLPKARKGGFVTKSGQAIVHEGEAIIPSKALQLQLDYLHIISSNIAKTSPNVQLMADNVGILGATMLSMADNVVDSFVKSGPLKSVWKGFKMFTDFVSFTANYTVLSGPAQKYSRRVIRRTAIDTIAVSAMSIFGQLSYGFEVMQDQLNRIIQNTGGGAITPKGRGLIDGPDKLWDRFKRFSASGDFLDLMSSDTGEQKAGGGLFSRAKGRLNSMLGRAPKAAMGSMVPLNVTKQGMVHVQPGEMISPSGDNAQRRWKKNATDTQQAAEYTKRLYDHTVITDRKTSMHQGKHWEWLRKNKFNALLNNLWVIMASVVGSIGAAITGVFGGAFSGIASLLGLKTITKGGAVSKASGALTGVGEAAEKGKFFKGGMFQSAKRVGLKLLGKGPMSALSKLLGGAKGVKGAGALVGVTGILGGVGAVKLLAPIAGLASKIFLPLLIITTVIDGIIGWTKAGTWFDTLKPTLLMKFSSLVGGVLDGLWRIIQWPVNFILERLGVNFQLPGLGKPIAKYLNFMGEMNLKILGFLGDSISNIVSFLMNPAESQKRVTASIKAIVPRILDFLQKDLPDIVIPNIIGIMKKFVSGVVTFFSSGGNYWKIAEIIFDITIKYIKTQAFLGKIVGKMVWHISKLIFWHLPKLFVNVFYSLGEALYENRDRIIPMILSPIIAIGEAAVAIKDIVAETSIFFAKKIASTVSSLYNLIITGIKSAMSSIIKDNPLLRKAISLAPGGKGLLASIDAVETDRKKHSTNLAIAQYTGTGKDKALGGRLLNGLNYRQLKMVARGENAFKDSKYDNLREGAANRLRVNHGEIINAKAQDEMMAIRGQSANQRKIMNQMHQMQTATVAQLTNVGQTIINNTNTSNSSTTSAPTDGDLDVNMSGVVNGTGVR